MSRKELVKIIFPLVVIFTIIFSSFFFYTEFLFSKINDDAMSVSTHSVIITFVFSALTTMYLLIAYYFFRSNKIIKLQEQLSGQEKLSVEQALRTSEERFETIFRNSPVATAIVDAEEFRTIDVNIAFEMLYGYKREEVIGKTSRDLSLYENIQKRDETLNIINKSTSVNDLEINVIRKDGEKRTVLLNVQHMVLDGKKCLLAVSEDITLRKRAEEDLRKSQQILSASEERFYTAFRANPDALVISRLNDGVIIEVNNTFIEFFGYSREEVIGQTSIGLNMYVNTEDRSKAIQILKEKGRLSDFELKVRTKTYEEKTVLLSAEILRTTEGHTFLTIIRDITETKASQIKMQLLLNDLQRSNRDLEAFAYSASHDLNEPIRMIKSYAQLIIMKEINTFSDSTLEFLGFIEQGATRMQQLVNDLLRYSRLSTRFQEFEEVDCNLVLSEVLMDLQVIIEDEKANVQITDLPKVRAIRTQLRQLFQNFIHNAIKFKGEQIPEIKVTCEKRNSVWLFCISDNGIGIEDQYFEKIFVIFQRLHTRDKYQGTGIGLAMCKKIIELHSGEICVDSEPGKGSAFYFTLPVHQ